MQDFYEIGAVMKRRTGREFTYEEPRFKTFDQIAATPLVAALDPELKGKLPALLINGQIDGETVEYATKAENVEKLWNLSEELVKEKFSWE